MSEPSQSINRVPAFIAYLDKASASQVFERGIDCPGSGLVTFSLPYLFCELLTMHRSIQRSHRIMNESMPRISHMISAFLCRPSTVLLRVTNV